MKPDLDLIKLVTNAAIEAEKEDPEMEDGMCTGACAIISDGIKERLNKLRIVSQYIDVGNNKYKSIFESDHTALFLPKENLILDTQVWQFTSHDGPEEKLAKRKILFTPEEYKELGFIWKQVAERGSLSKGAIANGPSHEEGGIKTITPSGPLEIEGGEAVINKEATEKHCELLSQINQSEGNGVAFDCNDSCKHEDKAKLGTITPQEAKKYAEELNNIHFRKTPSDIKKEIGETEVLDFLLDKGYRGSDNGKILDSVISELVHLGVTVIPQASNGTKTKNENNMDDLQEASEFLLGKQVLLYPAGVTAPIQYTIKGTHSTPKHFDKRELWFSFYGSEWPSNFNDYDKLTESQVGDLLAGEDVTLTDSKGEKYVISLGDIAKNGIKTNNPMGSKYYYLRIGNLIIETAFNNVIKIIGYSERGIEAVEHSEIRSKNKPQPFTWDFQEIIQMMDAKKLRIENASREILPYENDRDKILLMVEVDAIKAEISAQKHNDALQQRIIEKIGKTGASAMAKKELKSKTKDFEDTIGGVEAISKKINWDFNEKGNLQIMVDRTKYEIIYRDDKTQLYDLFEDDKLIASSKSVSELKKEVNPKASLGTKITKSQFKLGEPLRLIELAENGDPEKAIKELKEYQRLYEDDKNEGVTQKFGTPIDEIINEYKYAIEYINKNVGKIPNNYEGKTPEQVWEEWTEDQRTHFIRDHFDEINEKGETQKVKFTTWISAANFLINKPYSDIPNSVKQALQIHVNSGQYKYGGKAGFGEKVKKFFSGNKSKAPKKEYEVKVYNKDGSLRNNPIFSNQTSANTHSDQMKTLGYTTEVVEVAAKGKKIERQYFIDEDGKSRLLPKKFKGSLKPGSAVTDADGKSRIVGDLYTTFMALQKIADKDNKSRTTKKVTLTATEKKYVKTHKKEIKALKDAYPNLNEKQLIKKHKSAK